MLVHTRKRLGIPPQHYAFFQKMWQYLVPSGMADFLVAEIKGQPIGGATIFLFRDTLYVGYIASKPEYWPLGVDQALFWKAMQLAVQNSCKVCDIGKTSPLAEGLMTYKKRWGAQALETPCFYYPCPRGVSSLNDERRLSHKIMTLMWQRLPDLRGHG
jgi:lipid II:glycine glycyltransferase (peptidoglycan interpeptide bridge formation enzyme)